MWLCAREGSPGTGSGEGSPAPASENGKKMTVFTMVSATSVQKWQYLQGFLTVLCRNRNIYKVLWRCGPEIAIFTRFSNRIWNLKSEFWNPKPKIQNLKSAIWNQKSEIRYLESEIWNLKTGSWNPKSEIWNLKSEVWNPKPKIWNLKSEIWNQKSEKS